jgi:hypothetical protein
MVYKGKETTIQVLGQYDNKKFYWHCSYCHKSHISRSIVQKHEKICVKNPNKVFTSNQLKKQLL